MREKTQQDEMGVKMQHYNNQRERAYTQSIKNNQIPSNKYSYSHIWCACERQGEEIAFVLHFFLYIHFNSVIDLMSIELLVMLPTNVHFMQEVWG